MTWQIPCVLAVLLGPAQEGRKPATYARPRLLIDAAELAKPEAARKFRILDVRSLDEYKRGHIVHASTIDTPAWHKEFTAGPDKKTWEKRLGQLGIDADTPVVVYGDDPREAARVWWILRFWGIRDVRLLNGGWKAWKEAGGRTDTGLYTEPYYDPKESKLSPLTDCLADKEELLENVKRKRFQVADARSEKEYRGEEKKAKRGGAIPGACRLEWVEVIDPKTQRFKGPVELAKVIKEAGIDLGRPTVTYCQSGGRASVLAFALELMGAKDVRNYYRSWNEWGNDPDTPIVVPKK